MIVCSGASHPCALIRSATCSSGLDIGGLNVDRADTELFVAKALLVVRRHIVFDEIPVTLNFTYEIGLVAALVEIAMANLSIVVRSTA